MGKTIEIIGGPCDGMRINWYEPAIDDYMSVTECRQQKFQVPDAEPGVTVSLPVMITHRWVRRGDRLEYQGFTVK